MSVQMEKTYDPHGIEDKIYQRWLEKKYFHAEVDYSKKPFTIVIPLRILRGSFIWDTRWTTQCRIS